MNDELKNILTRVHELYLKYGIKSMTMDDVSRELGISKKTLYQHVTDKSDLVKKVLEFEIDIHECAITEEKANAPDAIEEIIFLHKHVNEWLKDYNPSREYDLKKYYPDLYQKYKKLRREKTFELVQRNIVKGKKEGVYRKEINEDVISKILLMRYEFFVETDLFSKDDYTSSKFFIEIMGYHIRGIATVKGLEVFEKLIKNHIGK